MCNGFYKARAFGGVGESLADFAHRFIEAVVEIHEGVRRPEFFLKFFASYYLQRFSTSMTRTWKGCS